MITPRSFLSWSVATIAGLFVYSSFSDAADKHVHGQAEMYIVIENQAVFLELESPADNILGFEHAPSNAAEQQRLEQMTEQLNDYQALVAFNNGDCKVTDASTTSPFKNVDDHHSQSASHEHKHDHEHKHGDHHHESNSVHADFLFSYTLQCNQIDKVDSVTIRAFDTLKRLEKLTVNWVRNDQQGMVQLNRNNTTINLRP